jgi:hypothetical protein
MKQIEYLMNQLYSQIGMTPSVLDGTADEKAMLNYNNRTIEPILAAIVGAMKRSFLSKTARTQGQTIMFFNNLFKLMTVKDVAESADSLGRNEIVTSNEFRQILGFKPSSDPKADELRNSNLNHPEDQMAPAEMPMDEDDSGQNPEQTDKATQEVDVWDMPISAFMDA